ncbi:MAG: acyl-CoA dehydrogenase family protein [Acidobacteriota bacterium]|nr:acyl-CoA dehydrogenase family protein [Acidobacteriota bacterium]
MNLDFSPEDEAFRDQVRTWLAEHAPTDPRPRNGMAMRQFDMGWLYQLWEAGWSGISWPVEYGGRGLPLAQQLIWHEEYARTGLPDIDSSFVGLNHAGPTLIARATDAQKQYHLPRILRGDVVWCQGFSEPEAGSDLASLRTRGVVDGDELVITGQKIWTSFAEVADWQELLVRTDPEAPKHKGISWVICDMHSPGIEVRPIQTMDGDRHFAEVFYDEVRVPLGNVVGRLNDGWSVAMSTLAFERGTAFTASQVALADGIERLIAVARTHPGPSGRGRAIDDDELGRRLARIRSQAASLRAMTYATISRNARSPLPGPEGSMMKLYYSDLHQEFGRLCMDVLGVDGLALGPDHGSDWTHEYLKGFSTSIGGGTSEIQRNIIGERVLGLPR